MCCSCQILRCRDAVGDRAVASHVTVDWCTGMTFWNTPTLPLLFSLVCPLSFIYGENDSIMPAHQVECTLPSLLGRDNMHSITRTGHYVIKVIAEWCHLHCGSRCRPQPSGIPRCVYQSHCAGRHSSQMRVAKRPRTTEFSCIAGVPFFSESGEHQGVWMLLLFFFSINESDRRCYVQSTIEALYVHLSTLVPQNQAKPALLGKFVHLSK